MPREIFRLQWRYYALIVAMLVGSQLAGQQLQSHTDLRAADTIEMTTLADRSYLAGADPTGHVALFSPDRSRFVVVIRHPNLRANTNDFSILFWRVADLPRNTAPQQLLTLSSSSNRDGISYISWHSNRTLEFLGERPKEHTQIYMYDLRTRALRRITSQPTNLVSFSLNARNGTGVFVAEHPADTLFDASSRTGVSVSGLQPLYKLILGIKGVVGWPNGYDLYAFRRGESPRFLKSVRSLSAATINVYLSPNGKYVVSAEDISPVPSSWAEYDDRFIRTEAIRSLTAGEFSGVRRLEVTDIRTGKSKPLLNSPVGLYGVELVWDQDGSGAIVTGIYMPLDDGVASTEERVTRRSERFVAEIDIPTGRATPIINGDFQITAWNPTTRTLSLRRRGSSTDRVTTVLSFQKNGGNWNRVGVTAHSAAEDVTVTLTEDMMTPPHIVACYDGKQISLLDLNPHLKELRLGKIENVQWRATDGHVVHGGLYYPAEYVAGKRYPLVIQTHGWNPNRFWINGPWMTSYAAQPLAARGLFVLQMEQSSGAEIDTPREAATELASFDGAIKYLDQRGLIDPGAVGLMGFSRTVFHVKYALSTEPRIFAAASVTDGFDGGYFQYVLAANNNVSLRAGAEGVNGGPPFGDTLRLWMSRSPGFNTDKVQTPVRILAPNGWALMGEWEWFAALTRLSKPVELILLQDGEHLLQHPRDQLASIEGNVDWFDFWLKGHEDPDPEKRAQYARWRELRKLQEQNGTKYEETSPDPIP